MSLKVHKDGYINSTVGERKITCSIIVTYLSLTMRESRKNIIIKFLKLPGNPDHKFVVRGIMAHSYTLLYYVYKPP